MVVAEVIIEIDARWACRWVRAMAWLSLLVGERRGLRWALRGSARLYQFKRDGKPWDPGRQWRRELADDLIRDTEAECQP